MWDLSLANKTQNLKKKKFNFIKTIFSKKNHFLKIYPTASVSTTQNKLNCTDWTELNHLSRYFLAIQCSFDDLENLPKRNNCKRVFLSLRKMTFLSNRNSAIV